MENVVVEISWSGNNFGAHVPALDGCVATGCTPEEIKKNIQEAIDFHVQGSLEDGDPIPDIFKHGYSLVFKFDTASLLQYYKGFITLAGLERLTGINQRQLQHYSTSLRSPRIEQKRKIEKSLHDFGRELLSVELKF